MYGVADEDGNVFCTVECFRRFNGVTANPYRMLFADEYDNDCTAGCLYDAMTEES